MRAAVHIVASGAAGAAAVLAGSPALGVSLFLSGSLMDIDHAELYLKSGMPSDPRALLRGLLHNEEDLGNRYGFRRRIPDSWAFPVLHSVELILLFAGLGLWLSEAALLGIAAGFLLHVAMDLGNYPESPMFFSLAWRCLARRRLMTAWETRGPMRGL